MKETANRGYPYPECNPPLVKDAGDLPLQLKNLAEAIDDDITALQALILDDATPPAVSITNPGVQNLGGGASFTFTVTLFDNDTIADLPFSRLLIKHTGLYMLVGTCSATGTPSSFHNLTLRVNGTELRTSSINPNLVAGDDLHNNVITSAVLNAGDAVTMSQLFSGAPTIAYNFSGLAAYRVVPL